MPEGDTSPHRSKHMALRLVRSDGALLYENTFEWHDEASWTNMQNTLFLVGQSIADVCMAAIMASAGWELQCRDIDGIETPPDEWFTLTRYP